MIGLTQSTVAIQLIFGYKVLIFKKFFCCAGQYSSHIELHRPVRMAAGRTSHYCTYVFNHLFLHSMGSIQMQYTILNAILSLSKSISHRPFKQILKITLSSLK